MNYKIKWVSIALSDFEEAIDYMKELFF